MNKVYTGSLRLDSFNVLQHVGSGAFACEPLQDHQLKLHWIEAMETSWQPKLDAHVYQLEVQSSSGAKASGFGVQVGRWVACLW